MPFPKHDAETAQLCQTHEQLNQQKQQAIQSLTLTNQENRCLSILQRGHQVAEIAYN